MMYVGFIHWRVPTQDESISKIIENIDHKDSFVKVYDNNGDFETCNEIFDRIKSNPSFIESSKTLKAMFDFLSTDLTEDIFNWKLCFTNGGNPIQLISDNPVILKNTNEENIFKSELIFPLSHSKSIYHTKGKQRNEITGLHKIKVDILIFLQAQRFVCGQDLDYLKQIKELSERYKTNESISILRKEIFEVLT